MHTIQPPAKVLVTGANGYVALWIVKTLLERGYSVRGTVRSESKTSDSRRLFKSYLEEGKLELVVVPVMEAKGAFDEAVKGVDAIAHVAAALGEEGADPKYTIDPAVNGTVGLLESALVHGSKTLKRVAIMSSCAAILEILPHTKVFTEEDWSNQSIEVVKKQGKEAPTFVKYSASKTLAERAAWTFWKEHKDQVEWDLVSLTPPFVFGPILQEVSRPEDLNDSSRQFYDAVIGGKMTNEQLIAPKSNWIDVRDLALAQALAFETEKAGGERMIISQGSYTWQDFLDVANSIGYSRPLNKGAPGKGSKELPYSFSNEKENKILGFKKRSMEETTRDVLAEFDARGL